MSKKNSGIDKHVGVNKDLLFSKIGEAITAIGEALETVETTLDTITKAHEVDIFDHDSLQDVYRLNSKRFNDVKNELRILNAIQGDVYEELLYGATKSMNLLINRVTAMVTLHNAMVETYVQPEILQVEAEVDAEPEVEPEEEEIVPIVPRKRGRPPAVKKAPVAKLVTVKTPRKVLDAEFIEFEIVPIELKVIQFRAASASAAALENAMCQQCSITLVKIEDAMKCLKCGYKDYIVDDEDDDNTSSSFSSQKSTGSETKRKPGGDAKFIEVIDAIQGKLVVKAKDKDLVENAVETAKKYFNCRLNSYDDFNVWFRGKHSQSAGDVNGSKRYSSIYKYGPYIYSLVFGIELASIYDHEFIKIERAYNTINIGFREAYFNAVSRNQSNKSIKPEFYIERLIEMYVKDTGRQNTLKSVIASKADESNSIHDIVWTTLKEDLLKMK